MLTSNKPVSIFSKIGCWYYERLRTELVIGFPWFCRRTGISWMSLCNRHEQLKYDSRTGGRSCLWRDSSSLTVARIFPQIGERLYRYLFTVWEVKLNSTQHSSCSSENPEVSVIIAFRGTKRMPLLLKVLEALRGQSGIKSEILVVEQSQQKSVIENWPTDVVHLHQFTDDTEGNFNKSSALNFGAARARSTWLAILDGDYIVPDGYLASVTKVDQSLECYWPARFIFYLDQNSIEQVVVKKKLENNNNTVGIEKIVQNNPTPFFIKRESYWKIGGHDEEFSGWGGEDIEFRDRARTLNCSEAGFLPIIHLWHAPAQKKANGNRNQKQMDEKLGQSPESRIADLKLRNMTLLTQNHEQEITQ